MMSPDSTTDHGSALLGRGLPIRCGPLTMRVGTSLPELAPALSFLYQDFPRGDDSLPDFDVRVGHASPLIGRALGQARASIDGHRAFDPFKRRHALPMFEWAVNFCVFTRPNRYLLLHAGVVERDGRGLILSGNPGAGKSTLTAALLFQGWRLFSDEVAMVAPGTREVLALPRPVSLKNESIEIIQRVAGADALGPSVSGTRKGTVAHLRPPTESVRRASEPADPRWIVFPQFEAGAAVELTPVSRADALLRVAAESFNYSVLGAVGFDTLADVVEGCSCHHLRFGTLADGLAAIQSLAETKDVAR